MTDCPHRALHAHVQNLCVTEVAGQPAQHWVGLVTATCAQCGCRFKFVGLPTGMSVDQPTVDETGHEVHLPMVPIVPDVSVC